MKYGYLTPLNRSDKPNLLILTSSFPASPTDETCGYIRDFARSLSVDFNVTVLAPRDRSASEWPADSFKLYRAISIIPLELDTFLSSADLSELSSANLLSKLVALFSLLCFLLNALALSIRADVICSHWMVPSGIVGALIRRVLGKPHIVVEHSGALHLLMRIRAGRNVARFIISGSERVVTVNRDLKQKLIALCPEANVEVIPMGVVIGPTSYKGIPDPPLTQTILFIGRLTAIKGLDVLLHAVAGHDDWRLIVAGDGECRGQLENLAQTLGVTAQFVGRIDAAKREGLLSACSVVVIPSRVLLSRRTEGMPVVCFEAMAAGRVVVASRIGGLVETIVDGDNGLLFDPSDSIMLEQKLMLVLGDDSLRKTLERNARISAQEYDWTLIGRRYCAIVNTALRKNDVASNRRIEARRLN